MRTTKEKLEILVDAGWVEKTIDENGIARYQISEDAPPLEDGVQEDLNSLVGS
jgi:hypothetical protein